MPAAARSSRRPPTSTPDRRHRRRQQTIEEILDVAIAIMAQEGAGGLSLGEVARRIGVRPPSLYVYFDSKNALYDAIFARGWADALDVVAKQEMRISQTDDPAGQMLATAQDFVRWAMANPAYAQLMFWRPVPGFEPSAQAYLPAVELLSRTTATFGVLRDRGVLRADVELSEAVGAWTSLVSGVISQQLSNAPHEGFENGSFTRLLPHLVSMFFAYYGPAVACHEGRNDGGTANASARPRPPTDKPKAGRHVGDGPTRRVSGAAAKSRRC
jgi:AcrR family transcriptional regulator